MDAHLAVEGEAEGKSFYFFDIDDNLMFLPTKIVLTHEKTGQTKDVSTGDYANIRPDLGKAGTAWAEWTEANAFVNFEDRPGAAPEASPLVADVRDVLAEDPATWQGPSWRYFTYACEHQRPTAFITARGHEPASIRAALLLLAQAGAIPCAPDILAIIPVGNPAVAHALGQDLPASSKPDVSALKRRAIRQLVDQALAAHDADIPHRFGMSDDDPQNVHKLIFAMHDCKIRYLNQRFFVINTHEAEHMKLEIFPIGMPAPRAG